LRSVVIGVVAACAAATSAHAAEPVDWTGVYVGLGVGYSWTHRVGKNFFSVTGNQIGTTLSESTSEGIFAGIHFGYDYMFDSRIVLGVEVEANRSWKKDRALGVAPGAITLVESRQEGTGSVRARLGYAFADWPVLPYVTAGVGFSRNITTRTQLVGQGGGLQTGMSEDLVSTSGSPRIGAGIECEFLRNWSARAEFTYIYSHEPFIIGSQSGTLDVGRIRPELIRLESRHVSLGVSYRF
jgi:opacity protein-like surface antigen